MEPWVPDALKKACAAKQRARAKRALSLSSTIPGNMGLVFRLRRTA
jgi:hypothetical protein